MKPGQALGIGVIGCGTIAYWSHLHSLKKLQGVQIAGFYDPDPDALTRARRLVDAPAYANAEELLASETVDAVIIASPSGLHARHLRMACEAGKHAYLEKPLAHDAASLATILNCTTDTNLVLTTGFNYRFHPACEQLRKLLSTGVIGEVRAIVSDFVEPLKIEEIPRWKRDRSRGGGVLLDLATHHIDLYRWFLGEELAGIIAHTRSLRSEQDSAFLRAETYGGVELCGYFAFTTSRSHWFTFHGSNGVLHLDMHSGRTTLTRNRRHGYGVRRRTVTGGITDVGWRGRKLIQPSYNPSYRAAMGAFVAALADPAQSHANLATVDDGAVALQAVLDAEAGAGNQGSEAVAGPVPT